MKYLYEKYLVKSHYLYWIVIICGLTLFIAASWRIPVDRIETLEATYVDGSILINEIFKYEYDYIYVYKSKSENVIKCEITDIEYVDDQYTIIHVKERQQDVLLEGNIKLDFVSDKSNLLKIVLGIEQKYMEKRYV